MCIKSSCTNCHSKSHCQEFSKNKQISKLERTIEHLNRRIEDTKSEDNEVMDELLKEIEEYKKLTEKLIKELEDSNKCLELAGEKIEKMKNCQNCGREPDQKHVGFCSRIDCVLLHDYRDWISPKVASND